MLTISPQPLSVSSPLLAGQRHAHHLPAILEQTAPWEKRLAKSLLRISAFDKAGLTHPDGQARRENHIISVQRGRTALTSWFVKSQVALALSILALNTWLSFANQSQGQELRNPMIHPDHIGPGGIPTSLRWRVAPGLQIFDFEHAPIFAGRTLAIDGVLSALTQQAEAGRPFVLILGASDSGKSSLVRAGVLPYTAAFSRRRRGQELFDFANGRTRSCTNR
jgi:hypothetical protein